jgi:uncharacterized protein (DUF983 family)
MFDVKTKVLNILKGKCPKCGKGNIYIHKSVFPLSKMLTTVDDCPVCGHKIKSGEENAPGINYAVSVIVYAIAVVFYACVWGITYQDNSFIYAFLFSTAVVILLQPWLMRLSKTIYIYVLLKFK